MPGKILPGACMSCLCLPDAPCSHVRLLLPVKGKAQAGGRHCQHGLCEFVVCTHDRVDHRGDKPDPKIEVCVCVVCVYVYVYVYVCVYVHVWVCVSAPRKEEAKGRTHMPCVRRCARERYLPPSVFHVL